MNLTEAEVQRVVGDLIGKHLGSDRGGVGSRATGYRHCVANVGFGSLAFAAQELRILRVLLWRGPQIAGRPRARSGRQCEFADAQETEGWGKSRRSAAKDRPWPVWRAMPASASRVAPTGLVNWTPSWWRPAP